MSVTRFENKTKVADITPNTDEILNKVADITPNIEDILNAVYPIGVIVCGAKPSIGTWEQIQGRFLVGAGGAYSVNATGGATSHTHTTGNHTLTVNEIPSHSHNLNHPYAVWGHNSTKNGFAASSGNWIGSDTAGGDYKRTANAGGGQGHNHGDTGSSSNLPPYLAVYMWRRTA